MTIVQSGCTSLRLTREVRERVSDSSGCQLYGDCPLGDTWSTDSFTVKPGVLYGSARDTKRTTSFTANGLRTIDENLPRPGYSKTMDTYLLVKTASGLELTTTHSRRDSPSAPPEVTTDTCVFESF